MNSLDRQISPPRLAIATAIGHLMGKPVPVRSSVLGAMLLTVLGGFGVALDSRGHSGLDSANPQNHSLADFALADHSLSGLLRSDPNLADKDLADLSGADLAQADLSHAEFPGFAFQRLQRRTRVIFHDAARQGNPASRQARSQ